jgi:4a-hydroxytetrahydrobiopterin dehydratase
VNTHSVGGAITELDFGLAHRVEDLAQGHGAR